MACCSGCRRSGISPRTPTGEALALNPANVQARNNLGQILERQRQFAAAADEYRQARRESADVPAGRFNLGRMLIAIGAERGRHHRTRRSCRSRRTPKPRDTCLPCRPPTCGPGRRTKAIKWATEARRSRSSTVRRSLPPTIERDLAKLK